MSFGLLPFPLPILVVKGAICAACLEERPKLSRCGGCKRVWYCNMECQKKHWKSGHKAACASIKSVNALYRKLPVPAVPHRTWHEYRVDWRHRLASIQRSSPPNDKDIARLFMYEPYCGTCRRHGLQLEESERLLFCKQCHISAFCAECTDFEPKSHDCVGLQSIYAAELFATQHFLQTGQVALLVPTSEPRTEYTPLSSVENWFKCFTEIYNMPTGSDSESQRLTPLEGQEMVSSAMTLISVTQSMICTIIAGLEAIYPALSTKTSLTLHFLGAQTKELDSVILLEEILHFLPKLKSLEFTFVGPELPAPKWGSGKEQLPVCETCTSADRTEHMQMFQGPYHTFMNDGHEIPDLAIAFHTGHSQEQVQQWTPTIEWIARHGGYTLFTTYNKGELEGEVEILKGLNAQFALKGQLNKWQSLKPELECSEEKENELYYDNQYCYIVKRGGVKE